jgi:hypothetical protein
MRLLVFVVAGRGDHFGLGVKSNRLHLSAAPARAKTALEIIAPRMSSVTPRSKVLVVMKAINGDFDRTAENLRRIFSD